jgi:hypothetical protein
MKLLISLYTFSGAGKIRTRISTALIDTPLNRVGMV